MIIFELILLAMQSVLASMVGYLLLLTAAAGRALRVTAPRPGSPTNRFLILIPAHNEEKLLPSSLASLNQLAYPSELYQVHVVADNCTDQTAALARQSGAIAHERHNLKLRGKGYALQWLLQEIWNSDEAHDAIVILDADTVVSPNFLRVMDARLAKGERVIQAYYAVRDPGRSPSTGLRYAALTVLHYLRPQGRMVLGGSAGLKGNGMVFTAAVAKQHEWSASITEDIEFHMTLLLNGERVTFAPDAVVHAEMPDTLDDSQTQNVRWEQGRLEMAREYVPQLLNNALREQQNGDSQRAFVMLDASMEHLIPPFSVLAGLSGLGLGLASFFAVVRKRSPLRWLNWLLGIAIVLGQLVYLLAGLKLANAPKEAYAALKEAPRFVFWKLLLYMGVVSGRGKDDWVRTTRNES